MAHSQQLNFINELCHYLNEKKQIFPAMSVLEIGSYDVNGTIRNFFEGSNYTGVDIIEGPGVDVVASGGDVGLPSNSFDLSISCECFEHNPVWVETFANMYRMTKDGCFMVVTCASTGRREHGTARSKPASSPGTVLSGSTYYRNLTSSDFYKNLPIKKMFSEFFFYQNNISHDLYFVGIKIGINNNYFGFNSLIKRINTSSKNLDKCENAKKVRIIRSIIHAPLYALNIFPADVNKNLSYIYFKFIKFIKWYINKIKSF